VRGGKGKVAFPTPHPSLTLPLPQICGNLDGGKGNFPLRGEGWGKLLWAGERIIIRRQHPYPSPYPFPPTPTPLGRGGEGRGGEEGKG